MCFRVIGLLVNAAILRYGFGPTPCILPMRQP